MTASCEAAVAAVRALHAPEGVTDHAMRKSWQVCRECEQEWPCPTVHALDNALGDTAMTNEPEAVTEQVHLATHVVIDEDTHTLTIEGRVFPWHISEDGIEVTGLGSAHEPVKRVTFTLLAERVEVIAPAPAPATHEAEVFHNNATGYVWECTCGAIGKPYATEDDAQFAATQHEKPARR